MDLKACDTDFVFLYLARLKDEIDRAAGLSRSFLTSHKVPHMYSLSSLATCPLKVLLTRKIPLFTQVVFGRIKRLFETTEIELLSVLFMITWQGEKQRGVTENT